MKDYHRQVVNWDRFALLQWFSFYSFPSAVVFTKNLNHLGQLEQLAYQYT